MSMAWLGGMVREVHDRGRVAACLILHAQRVGAGQGVGDPGVEGARIALVSCPESSKGEDSSTETLETTPYRPNLGTKEQETMGKSRKIEEKPMKSD